MDLVIELDNEGRIWVTGADGAAREEAWLLGADDTPSSLRVSGLCLLEEKYTAGRWSSTTLDQREMAGAVMGGSLPRAVRVNPLRTVLARPRCERSGTLRWNT